MRSRVKAYDMLKVIEQGTTRDNRPVELMVRHVQSEERRVPPPSPLNTIFLLRLASDHLHFAPELTMALADELYYAGLLSCPRTQACHLAPSPAAPTQPPAPIRRRLQLAPPPPFVPPSQHDGWLRETAD